MWNSDQELFDIAKQELFPALVGDILDKLGYQHQFLDPAIKPVKNDMVVIGRAMPVLEADVFEESAEKTNNPLMKKPFGIMFVFVFLCALGWTYEYTCIKTKSCRSSASWIFQRY